jgi:hypothetical protein
LIESVGTKVLGRIFGKEITGESREELHNLYFSPTIIRVLNERG